MSDSDEKKGFEAFKQSRFFTFSKPYLDFIGKGTIYNLVYIVMTIINLLLPVIVIIQIINSGIFRLGAKFIIASILSMLVITFACWIGMQLWWNRRNQVTEVKDSEFIATPIISDIFRTFGEWIGTLIAIIGAGVGLIALIFLGRDMNFLFRLMNLSFLADFGWMVIFIGPVLGFFIIIISRFIAEQLRIFAAIANNTKDIAQKK